MNDDWDINEFEEVKAHHYCKNNSDDEKMIETDMITGEITKGNGFRYELLDKNMNPVIMMCIIKDNITPKAKGSGVKAQLKFLMRKDRHG